MRAFASRALDFLEKERALIACMLGLGLCRGCLGWALSLIRNASSSEPFGIPAHHLIGLGEAAAFFFLAAYARRKVLVSENDILFSVPLALIPVGAIGMYASTSGAAFSASPLGGAALLTGCAVLAAGYATLLIMWLEHLSQLAPRKALCTFSLAYFVNVLMWLACGQMAPLMSLICCLLAACLSLALLIMAERGTPSRVLPRSAPSRGLASGRLLLWIIVLSLAFGIGESITNMGYSTTYSKLGMALPELTVLLGLWLLPRRFDIGIFSKATLALVLVGLVGAFFSHTSLWASQVTLSASNESLQMFALMIACFAAHQRRCSPAYYCALIMGCMTLFIRLGLIAGQALAPSVGWLYVVILALVALSGIALLREDKFDSQLHLDCPTDASVSERLAAISMDHGLSKREQSVFLLLARGDGYEDISESLFIAPSTVRAHASRIYEKFGKHTRKEFEDALAWEVSGKGTSGKGGPLVL